MLHMGDHMQDVWNISRTLQWSCLTFWNECGLQINETQYCAWCVLHVCCVRDLHVEQMEQLCVCEFTDYWSAPICSPRTWQPTGSGMKRRFLDWLGMTGQSSPWLGSQSFTCTNPLWIRLHQQCLWRQRSHGGDIDFRFPFWYSQRSPWLLSSSASRNFVQDPWCQETYREKLLFYSSMSKPVKKPSQKLGIVCVAIQPSGWE